MLTPLQRSTLDRLRPARDTRLPSDPELASSLRDRIEHEVGGLDQDLVVTKRKLSLVHGCERHLVETEDHFSWSVPAARGTITHKAIELLVYRRGRPSPTDLAEEAVEALEAADSRSLGVFLADLGEPHRTGLIADVSRLVDSFMSVFPPLPRSWRPVAEGSIRVSLAEGRVQLVGRPDLTLGGPDGDVPGRVIVDLKTGSPVRSHRDDLRFYALLDTLRNRVPPLMVASVFLDSGDVDVESVDAGTLEASARRTVDGIHRLAEVLGGSRPPVERPGPVCRWCPAQGSCDAGQAHLAAEAADGRWDR